MSEAVSITGPVAVLIETAVLEPVEISIASVGPQGPKGEPGAGVEYSDDSPMPLVGEAEAGVEERAARSDHAHQLPSASSVGAFTLTSCFAELDNETKKAAARQNLGIDIVDGGTF